MKKFVLPLFALLFVLSACSNSKDTKKDKDDDTEVTGKNKGNKEDSDDEGSGIQSSPEALMKGIFKAAKSGDYSALSDICAPGDAGDNDVKDICGIGDASSKDQEEFRSSFKNSKIVEEPSMDGDNEAIVKFTLGDREEEMHMVKKNKKWYLLSF